MENQSNNDQIMSYNINELATALAKAQAEFTTAKKDKDNPFFKSKYADFESVVIATRPALTKHGLSIVQNVYRETDGHHYLITLLLHSSGQWIKSKAQHNPMKSDIQSLSSYNTYLKRMCYSSIVGAVTGEEDDDGEASIVREKPQTTAFALEDMLIDCPNIKQRILNKYQANSIKEINYKFYNEIARGIKATIEKEGKN